MEGNKNKKRENTKEKTRGRKRMCRIGEGGRVADLWEGLNYKFAPKISSV